jgi:hypothetical protein
MGDIQNTVSILRRELRSISYRQPLNWHGILVGDTVSLIPIIQYSLYSFSPEIRKYIDTPYEHVEMFDVKRFLQALYSILRSKFDYVPRINIQQFLGNSYVESKLSVLVDVIRCIKAKLEELTRLKKNKKLDRSFSSSRKECYSPTRNIHFRPASSFSRSCLSSSIFCYDSPSKSTQISSVSASRSFASNSSFVSVGQRCEDGSEIGASVSHLKEEMAAMRSKVETLETLTQSLLETVARLKE